MNAIEVEHLTRRFGGVTAVRDVSFGVPAGQVVAVLGPNGAGKTTLIEILEGFQSPTSGRVRVLGTDPRAGGRTGQAWRARVGLVLQSTSLDHQLTVSEALRLYASLFGRPLPAAEVLTLIGLTGEAGTRIGALSGGQQRRVDLGLAVIGRPEVLFLDEPTAGLDPQTRVNLWDMLRALHDEGQTILLTTHYMEEAEALCDRVAVVDHGKVLASGTIDELKDGAGADTVITVRYEGALPGGLALPAGLETRPGISKVETEGDQVRVFTREPDGVLGELVTAGASAGLTVSDAAQLKPSLETVFLNLTGREYRE